MKNTCIFLRSTKTLFLMLDTTKLIEIFISCDDFLKEYQPQIDAYQLGQTNWKSALSKSEALTILIYFHLADKRNFKSYYQDVILNIWKSWFPDAPSYTHFVSLIPKIQMESFIFLHTSCLEAPTANNFIDSKPLEVCHIKREKQHKVFDNLATKGKTSKGYFFGLKIHVVCNQNGGIVKLKLSTGKTSDNTHELLRTLLKNIQAKVYGDKGYNSAIKEEFAQQGTQLIAKPKKNMKNKKLTFEQTHYLKARAVIESVFEILTHGCHLDHTRHRSPKNFIVNLWTAFIAYAFKERKPSAKSFNPICLNDRKIALS